MDLTRRSLIAAATLPGLATALNAAELGVKSDAKADQSKALQSAIDAAAAKGEDLFLPAGKYKAEGLKLKKSIRLFGIPGRTVLVAPDGGSLLAAANVKHVTLSGLTFQGNEKSGVPLVLVEDCAQLEIAHSAALGGAQAGFVVKRSAGRIAGCEAGFLGATGILALDSKGMEIVGCHVHDIGDNGIQVWRSAVGEDGTLVTGNRVERIGAAAGGSGQNGNGINVYRAGSVLIQGNRVTDCAYSAIRDNSGSNCQILGNSISRTDEVAIYVEFAFEGAVVSGNLIEDVCFGISITNLDQGGRLAVCANNLVRDAKGGRTAGVTSAGGIYAEADTAVTGNVVENARDVGIALGWGKYCRNLMATGNLVKDCGKGFTVSAAAGAESATIANNTIVGAKLAAVMAMDHREPASGDLTKDGAVAPPHIHLAGNVVR